MCGDGRELFDGADKDGGGILDQREFTQLIARANKDTELRREIGLTSISSSSTSRPRGHGESSPTAAERAHAAMVMGTDDKTALELFDPQEAWLAVKKVPYSEGTAFGVNSAGFETWWKIQVGLNEPDIPVLPEFMVARIEEKVNANKAWSVISSVPSPHPTAPAFPLNIYTLYDTPLPADLIGKGACI